MAREDSKTDQLCRCNDASFHQGRGRKSFWGNELLQTELASQCGESSCCITQGGVRESAAVWGTLLAGAFLFSVFLTNSFIVLLAMSFRVMRVRCAHCLFLLGFCSTITFRDFVCACVFDARGIQAYLSSCILCDCCVYVLSLVHACFVATFGSR